MEVADLAVDTNAFDGTTRECFQATLAEADPRDQAAALREILEIYPPPDAPVPDRPRFRTESLHREIRAWISRLETGEAIVRVDLPSASAIVRRALADADSLIRTTGPQSAVDRVHTAMHGYLHNLCAEANISVSAQRPTMGQLFKALRAEHPALADLGMRADDVARMLGSMASILDALNPVRNSASVAHPNEQLICEAEAVLVVNSVRTMLAYLEKRRTLAATITP